VSERLHRLGAIIRADFFIRLRRPSTVVVFLLLSFVAYLWIPAPSTGRALIVISGQRAIYNSATIGMGTASIGTIFIGLFGFYVISNALKRDVLSRCGFVIASTTMRGSEYILGKFAGNFVFLAVFTLGYMATSMAMVLVRGEAPLEPLVFARQYLLLMPPSLAFVSAIAVVFECTPLLRTKFGDVFYFFLWAAMMGAAAVAMEKNVGATWASCVDVSGFGFMIAQMKGYYHTSSMSIGASNFDAAKPVLHFAGLQFGGAKWVLPRIIATLWPIALLAIARLFFHRFDPARVRSMPNEKSRRSWMGGLNALAKPVARLFVFAGQTVARIPAIPTVVRAMITDALATIAAFPLLAVALIVFGFITLAADAKSLFTGALPAAFAACAIALADIACREKRSGTSALVFATPKLRANFVLWKFGTAVLVALTFLGIPLIKAIVLRPTSALPLLVGVIFTAAAATMLGIVSANPKTFIVGFLTFWYVALNDKGASPSLDFAGWFGKSTPTIAAAYAAGAIALLVAAQVFHTYDLRRRW
jgi:hypothetical protein